MYIYIYTHIYIYVYICVSIHIFVYEKGRGPLAGTIRPLCSSISPQPDTLSKFRPGIPWSSKHLIGPGFMSRVLNSGFRVSGSGFRVSRLRRV